MSDVARTFNDTTYSSSTTVKNAKNTYRYQTNGSTSITTGSGIVQNLINLLDTRFDDRTYYSS